MMKSYDQWVEINHNPNWPYCKCLHCLWLAAWPRNPNNMFKFKNCLFGATSIVKNSNKEKYVYSGYEITFDGAYEWSFDKWHW